MRLRRVERGAGGVEYLGVLLVVAVLLVTTVGVAGEGSLVDPVKRGVCGSVERAVGVLGVDVAPECAEAPAEAPVDEPPPDLGPCVQQAKKHQLTLGAAGLIFQAETAGKDSIVTSVDPDTGKETATVILGGNTAAGAGFDTDSLGLDLPFEANASANVGGGLGYVYTFDSKEEAAQFLENRRASALQQALGVVAGGNADALFDLSQSMLGDLFGLPGADELPVPSGVTFDVAAQAEAGVSFETPAVGGIIPGMSGEVDLAGKVSSQFQYNFDGSTETTLTLSGLAGVSQGVGGTGGSEGTGSSSGSVTKDDGGAWKGNITYKVKTDPDGDATLLVSVETLTETSTGVSGEGTKDDGQQGTTTVEAGGSTSEGDLEVTTYEVDLDSENADALMEAMADADGDMPKILVDVLSLEGPIGETLKENSVETQYVYDTEGTDLGATGALASKGKKWFIGLDDTTYEQTLVSAEYTDHGAPGDDWHDVPHC